VGQANGTENDLTGQQYITEDVSQVLPRMAGLPMKDPNGRRGCAPSYTGRGARAFDIVVLAAPRWASTKPWAVDLVGDHQSLLKPAFLAEFPGGQLLFTNNVAFVDRDAWQELCLGCARKAARPVADWSWLPPEHEIPSPDGQPPQKMAILTLENAA
jgi:23S rRNA (cytosine1962-C5)-methyltransferase